MTIEYRVHSIPEPVERRDLFAALLDYLDRLAVCVSTQPPEATGYAVDSYLAQLRGRPSDAEAPCES